MKNLVRSDIQRSIPVGILLDDQLVKWQGGFNYYRSLLGAIEEHASELVEPVIFTGNPHICCALGLSHSARTVYSSVFRRGSPSWLLNQILFRLLGRSLLSNRVIRAAGVKVLSHCKPSGSADLKSAAWIPDFQHLRLPSFFSEKEVQARDRAFHSLMANSDLVIVSSQDAESDLRKFFPSYAEKARVLRFAANLPLRPAFVEKGSLESQIRAPYFYIPNQLWAHKNHIAALRALEIISATNPEISIVCSGSLNDYRGTSHISALQKCIRDLGLEKRFLLLGLIPYEHIHPLMAGAVAVINPSFFEGWSTTVEEAKAMGVPLLLSDIAVHHEQCDNDQALFFDPSNPASLADAMLHALDNANGDIDRIRIAGLAIESYRTVREGFALSFASIVRELHDSAF